MKAMITLVLAGLLVATVVCGAYAADAVTVNINTASAEELSQLTGVGPRHAAGIIAYRQKNGPFKHPGELIRVSGIGPKTVERNKGLILVEDPGKKPVKK